MRSNPYVYPYTPFEDLSNKNIRKNFIGEKFISNKDLLAVIGSIVSPRPVINGDTTEEKTLSIFLDNNFLFGPEEYILQEKSVWLGKFGYFINQKLPVQFTILGFPFKVPVPLKTNRTLPDMGEVLSLLRLQTIVERIREVYEHGAVITIFTEGAFGRFSGVPDEEWILYREQLKNLIRILGYDDALKIEDLSDMEKELPDFSAQWENRVVETKELYKKGDVEFSKKYHGAYQSIYHITSTRGYADDVLMDAYNDDIKDSDATAPVQKIRNYLRETTHETIFKYHAYLWMRDKIGYLDKIVPHGIQLTVSPKPGRLGIIPIHRDCIRLPYHGVPVFYAGKNTFFIEYFIDIKRRAAMYVPVYLSGDKEKSPFYYISD